MALSVEETEELIDDLNEYANSSVKVLEQAVVLVSRTKNGENVIQFPLTRLRQIEDIKDLPLEDGGLEWDDNMKLYVEASDLLQDGGGLTTDDNGDIYVDFSLMPTDKFEDLLKTLTIPIYLDANLYQYVDCNNGDDTIEDGRGSEDMPWKTISACVDYCTTYYNVNSHHIEIRVLAGTYDEQLNLGDFSRTTGYINVISYSGEHQTIVHQENATTIYISAGSWRLTGLRIECVINDNNTDTTTHTYSALEVSGGTATCTVYGCAFYINCEAASYGTRNIYGVWVENAAICYLMPYNYTMSFEFHRGEATGCAVLRTQTSAVLYLIRNSTDGYTNVFEVQGECVYFCYVNTRGLFSVDGIGDLVSWEIPDGETVTGQRYIVLRGGACNASDNTDDNSYFPGDTAGTVDEDTYCWYQ